MLKVGDVVFFQNRNLIEWEANNPANFWLSELCLNTIYSVSALGKNIDGTEYVTIYGNDNRFHLNHFKKVEGDDIQGQNIFAVGTTVEFIGLDPMQWETTYDDGIKELKKLVIGNTFLVKEYLVYDSKPYMKIISDKVSSYFHSNHFKKVV